MNTKTKLKAISIGIAAIMMFSLFAVMSVSTSVSASVVTDCWIGDDNKVYFTVYSGEKVDRVNGQLYLNGAYSGEHRMFSLNAGETATLSFRTYRWNGVDEVEVLNDVDDGCCNPIAPTPTPTPTPSPGPDLVITNCEPVGNIIHYTIKNIGGEAAPISLTGLWIDDAYRAANKDKTLAPGEESDEVFAKYNYRGGEIEVCADYQDRIEEANEDNNCNSPGPGPTPTPTPTPGPDLVITKCEPVGNIIHYTIKNIGGEAAPGSLTGLYIDDIYRASEKDDPLAPGEESNEVFARYIYRGGDIRVCADYQNRIEEANEDNNCN